MWPVVRQTSSCCRRDCGTASARAAHRLAGSARSIGAARSPPRLARRKGQTFGSGERSSSTASHDGRTSCTAVATAPSTISGASAASDPFPETSCDPSTTAAPAADAAPAPAEAAPAPADATPAAATAAMPGRWNSRVASSAGSASTMASTAAAATIGDTSGVAPRAGFRLRRRSLATGGLGALGSMSVRRRRGRGAGGSIGSSATRPPLRWARTARSLVPFAPCRG